MEQTIAGFFFADFLFFGMFFCDFLFSPHNYRANFIISL